MFGPSFDLTTKFMQALLRNASRLFQAPSSNPINVQTDKLHWDKVKVGDRIKVSYRQGKYTGTVWAAEIDYQAWEGYPWATTLR